MSLRSTILVRVGGDDSDAQSVFDRLRRSIGAVDKQQAEPSVDVDTDDAESRLDRVVRSLARVDGAVAEPQAILRAQALDTQLGRLTDRLEALDAQEASPRVTTQTATVLGQVAQVQARLEKLAASSATVTVDVDGSDAVQARVKVLTDRLAALDEVDATPQVRAETRLASLELDRLSAELTALGGRRVEAKVDVDRDGSARGAMGRIGVLLGTLGLGAGAAGKSFGALGIPVSFARAGLVAIIPVVAAAISGVLALGPALVSAAAALGALGVATGAAGAVLGVFAAGVVRRFTIYASQAGSAAHGLAQAFRGLKVAFGAATAGGADQVFARLTPAIALAGQRIGALRSSFTGLGATVGAVGASLLRSLTAPPQLAAFAGLIRGTGAALGPVASLARSFGSVLLTIAQAALPLLVSGLQRVATSARSWASSFGSVGSVRQSLERMMGTTGQLGRIIANFGSAGAGVFRAFGQATGGVLRTLESFSASLARATNSPGFAAGVGKMLSGLKSLGSFASGLGTIIAGAVRIIGPAFAPVVAVIQRAVQAVAGFVSGGGAMRTLGPIFQQIGSVLGTAIGYGVDVFQRLLAAVRPALPILQPLAAFLAGVLKGAFAALKPIIDVAIFAIRGIAEALGFVGRLLAPFSGALEKVGQVVGFVFAGPVIGAVGKVLGVLGKLPGVAGTVFGLFGKAAQLAGSVLSAVGSAIAGVFSRITGAGAAMRGATTAAWNGIKSAVTSVVNAVRSVVQLYIAGVKSIVTGAWQAIRSATTTAWNAVRGAISGAWQAISGVARSAASGVRDVVTGAWSRVRNATSAAWDAVTGAVRSAWRSVTGLVRSGVDRAIDVVQGLGRAMFGAGESLIRNLAGGIQRAMNWAIDKVRDGLRKIRDLMPGSEPRDASSPLRGLADRGRAIMGNLAAGIPGGAEVLRQQLDVQLSRVVAQALPAQVAPVAPAAPASGPTQNVTNVTANVAAPQGGGPPDAQSLEALLAQSLRNRGGLAVAR